MSMRTPKTEAIYQKAIKDGTTTPLSQEPKLEGAIDCVWWTIIDNRFPHDKRYKRHIMAVLNRDCNPHELHPDELYELWFKIFPWADAQKYDIAKFNFSSLRSINSTIHVHLAEVVDEDK